MKELVYHRFLLPTAERLATKTAVMDGDFTATYEQHVDRVLRLSNGLSSELGVGPGERFAVMALNGHQFLELYHASFLGGAMINPLNLRLASKELEFVLQDSGCKTCFVDAWFAAVVDAVRAGTALEKVVLIGGEDVPHDVAYEDVVAAGSSVVPPEPHEDAPAFLMYTGGTTGLPKGVVMDSRALVLNLYKALSRFAMTDRYVYLHQTPIFHAASLPGV
ncbi:MAG: acyl--CoA ligase, partial [Acidimicrobiales bacterium]|nr:acyl--CoA ligase [Acidimicrobiales bacterium]